MRAAARACGRGQRDSRDARTRGAGRRAAAHRSAKRRDRYRIAPRAAIERVVVKRLTTRILLADDHALVRRGLRLILDAQPDLEVVAEARDGAEAVKLALSSDVDLA